MWRVFHWLRVIMRSSVWAWYLSALVLSAGAAGLIWVLSKFWGLNLGYFDRFFFIAGAAYLAYDRRLELARLTLHSRWWGWPMLLLGAIAFPVGWFLQAQVAPKPITLWWLTLSWLAAVIGFTLVAAGWNHLRRVAFPLAFLLFAIPMPNRVHVPLQTFLQGVTTSVSEQTLWLLGYPVQRDGFVLHMPTGDLGVAEACSGVKSVTILAGLSTLIAYLMGFRFLRGIVLFVLSIPVIAAVNILRVVLSGIIQEWFGSDYIQGDWHEALGMLMVLLGIALEIGLALVLEPPKTPRPKVPDELDNPITSQNQWSPSGTSLNVVLATVVLALSGIATIAAQFLGLRLESEVVANAPLQEIPAQLGSWKALPRLKADPHVDTESIEQAIPPFVPELLTYDNAVFRIYQNEWGTQVSVWVIFWSSQNMVKGYHHPDICLGNRGFVVRHRERIPLSIDNGATIPVTVREFVLSTDKSQRQLVHYWTQEGRRIWTEDDERAAYVTGDSHRWISDRLFGAPDAVETGRIVVLLSTTLTGDGALTRKDMLDFTRELAEAIYELCPWAKPFPSD